MRPNDFGKSKLLIVEDDFLIAHTIQMAAQKAGIEVIGKATKMDEAITLCQQIKPDFATMDVKLKDDISGFEVARVLEEDFAVPSFFISAFRNELPPACAALETCLGWIDKPFSAPQLKLRFEAILTVLMQKSA